MAFSSPGGYFNDVITRIVQGHPQSQIGQLMPWEYPTQAR